MTPGTGAERQTPTRHDGAHAAQRRTHAGDMNVAPTLPAVPTHTDEKTAGHHDRTAAYPVRAPFMTPGTGAERQTSSCHNGTLAGDMNVAPALPAVSTRTDEKTTGYHDRTATYPAVPTRTNEKTAGHHDRTATYPTVPTCTDDKTTGHHDRTAAYPVGAPFMTPGTEAVRQTSSRRNGAHAVQQRTHAGDMNVAPTLTAVPTHTDEKNGGASRPHGSIPGRGAIYDARYRSGETNIVMPRRRPRGRHKRHGPDMPPAHTTQWRTHAGGMNVAPTLTAVPTCTDEKTAGHHDRTVAHPVGAPFMTPGTEAVRQTPSCHDGAHAAQQRTLAGDMNVAPTLTAVPIRATGKSVGELEFPDALTGFSVSHRHFRRQRTCFAPFS